MKYVSPVWEINDKTKKIQREVLAMILKSVIVVTSLYGAVQYLFAGRSFIIAAAIIAADIVYVYAIYLNRKENTVAAAVVSSIAFSAAILVSAVNDPEKTEHLFVLALPILIASFVLDTQGVLILAAANIVLSLLLSLAGLLPNPVSLANPVLFVCLFSILIAVNREYRNSFETHRKEVLRETRDATIYALAYEAELRDAETGEHLDRTSKYVRLLVSALKENPQYRDYINGEYIDDLTLASVLHDIGKVGIPDSILLKPGKLTPEEFEKIKEHCRFGYSVLQEAARRLQYRSIFDLAVQLVLYHHERWDGKGYPSGKTGGEIPLSGRIMAVADVYDALTSRRSYKKAFSHEESRAIILEGRGSAFDPELVDAFLRVQTDFAAVAAGS